MPCTAWTSVYHINSSPSLSRSDNSDSDNLKLNSSSDDGGSDNNEDFGVAGLRLCFKFVYGGVIDNQQPILNMLSMCPIEG